MGMEERARRRRSARISLTLTAGETTSRALTHGTTQAEPGLDRFPGAGGASCATTRPRLVMSTGLRVRRTRSMSRRQCALNSVAVTFMFDRVIISLTV